MSALPVFTNVTLTPEQVASAFWNMGSDEQVRFFAELDRQAGVMLCLQMAAVVHEMALLDTETQVHAINGFRTMLMHAADYAASANEYRASRAHSEIEAMVRSAKRSVTHGY